MNSYKCLFKKFILIYKRLITFNLVEHTHGKHLRRTKFIDCNLLHLVIELFSYRDYNYFRVHSFIANLFHTDILFQFNIFIIQNRIYLNVIKRT